MLIHRENDRHIFFKALNSGSFFSKVKVVDKSAKKVSANMNLIFCLLFSQVFILVYPTLPLIL